MNKVQPEAPTASPAIDEQRVRVVLEAEIWKDIEGGPDSLCLTTDVHATEPVSPARMLRMVEETRAKLNDIERLAKVFEARDTLAAIIAEHDLTLVEVDMRTVAEFAGSLANRLGCWAGRENGRLVVWVPKDQDPIARTNAVADLVNAPGSIVREG